MWILWFSILFIVCYFWCVCFGEWLFLCCVLWCLCVVVVIRWVDFDFIGVVV